jgi:hypothetical protein
MDIMDIEVRLRKLESKYRATMSAAVAAKAHYLSLAGEPGASPRAVELAKLNWQKFDARKQSLALQMGELEMIEDSIG